MRAHLRLLLAGLAVLALCSACSGGYSGPSIPAPTAAATPLVIGGSSANVVQKWQAQPGTHFHTSPAVAGDTIYTAYEDECICALDAATGSVKWRVPPPGIALSEPVVANGLVYVGMEADLVINPEIMQTSYVYAFDANSGAGVWTFHGDHAGSEDMSMPVVADGLLFAGSGHADGTGRTQPSGLISAVDARTGELKWQKRMAGDESRGVAAGSGLVFFTDGHEYVYNKDHLHAVDAKTGAEVWNQALDFDLDTLPFVQDGIVYYGNDKGGLFALDAATGQEKWHATLAADEFASPAITDGVLYFAANQRRAYCIDMCPRQKYTDYLYALDAKTGAEQWKFALTDRDSGPLGFVLYGGALYTSALSEKTLAALDARTGQVQWSYNTGDHELYVQTVDDGIIYVRDYDGVIYAMQAPGVATATPAPPEATVIPATVPAGNHEAPAKGFHAPDFTLTDLRTHQPVTLSALRGKPVMINFWATWCDPSHVEMPIIEKLYARYKNRVQIIGISPSSSDTEQGVRDYIDKGKYSWIFLHDADDSVGSRYTPGTFPTSFFIDSSGVIRAIHIGGMTEEELESELAALK